MYFSLKIQNLLATGVLGNNSNFHVQDLKHGFDYTSVATVLVAPFSRGIIIGSLHAARFYAAGQSFLAQPGDHHSVIERRML